MTIRNGCGIYSEWQGLITKSLLTTLWTAKVSMLLQADCKDADQTAQMSNLIWVFTGYTSEGIFSHFVSHVLCKNYKMCPNLSPKNTILQPAIFSIGPDRHFFNQKSTDSFSYFSRKTYVVGTHQKSLLISIHNIYFPGEIRKMFYMIQSNLNSSNTNDLFTMAI